MHRQGNRKSLVALVEDNTEMCSILEGFFLYNNFDIRAYCNPESFLEDMDRGGWKKLSLLISDIKMPKLTGMQLLQESMIHSPGLPVILMTAAPSKNEELLAKVLGAAMYLAKPINLEEILAKARSFLGPDGNGLFV